MQEKRPWEMLKGDAGSVADAGIVINVSMGIALVVTGLIEPFIPNVSAKVICSIDSLK